MSGPGKKQEGRPKPPFLLQTGHWSPVTHLPLGARPAMAATAVPAPGRQHVVRDRLLLGREGRVERLGGGNDFREALRVSGCHLLAAFQAFHSGQALGLRLPAVGTGL